MFGSTTAFGQSSSSPFGSQAVFGQTSNANNNPFAPKPFGSTTPFGSQTGGSIFGGTSTGMFGTPQTSSPFSSATPFGASSSPAFGSTMPAFGGSSSTSAFGNSSTSFGGSSVFGQKPAFGGFGSTPQTSPFASTSQQSQPAFGSSLFGSTTPFGASSQSAFGSTGATFGSTSTTPSFGTSSTLGFGASTPSFGTTSTFGSTASPAFGTGTGFGVSSTPVFGSGGSFATSSTPAFGAAGSAFGVSSTPGFATSSTPAFGASTTPAFGSTSAFGTSSTPSFSFSSSPGFGQSASAFGSSPFGTTTSPFSSQSSPFVMNLYVGSQATTPTFGNTGFGQSAFAGHRGGSRAVAYSATAETESSGGTPGKLESISAMPVYKDKSHEELRWEDYQLGDKGGPLPPGQSSVVNNFGVSSAPSNPFAPSNTFAQSAASPFSSTISSNPFSTKPFGNPLSQSTPFQLSQPSTSLPGFGNFGQSQAASTSGFAGSSSIFGQSTFGQLSTTQSSVALQPAPVTNPFGTLPAMPQMSIGRAGTTPSVQYGISSMPVVDKPAPVRISSLLTARHLSQRRIRLPARKYNHKHDGPSDEEETTSTPKADALFIPRENPRALVIHPTDQWPLRANAEKASPLKDASTPVYENGKLSEAVDVPSSSGSGAGAGGKDKNMVEDGFGKERVYFKLNQKPNGVHEDNSTQKEESYMTLSGHRAGEAAIVYEHGADIEALMPKLRRSDYYTEPRIQELAAKERAEPGFCRHVKDFVVGRHGYGSIKFLGETDVRRLDLESLVQFNNREVIVYTDDTKKPPVGQGLNKPAEVTLLNIKCFDKKTGRQYSEGPKIEKYKEMLKRKAEDQGAEFVSYDPVKGEWKFRVNHFSKYMLGDEDEEMTGWWCILPEAFVKS
ncbi:hypothetical protein GH714_011107 [Hevea brasiliensis]|uniref:Nucleoporin autopeptidase n=1 Tax=Hevea brasiliensis TaxID=3981 RepID=A0A6A6LDA2_HEVBR|nr:hypothetical protein GH714_011107 [Hevea brasiliensis]